MEPNFSKLSALELQALLDSKALGTFELAAVQEIDRLRDLLVDIVDICNTDSTTYKENPTRDEWLNLIEKIDDIAHKYFNP